MVDTVGLKFFVRSCIAAALMLATFPWCAPDAGAQTGATTPPPQQQPDDGPADDEAAGTDAVTGPVVKDYKGVRIGMTADEAREKLGKPESKGVKQDFFVVSDNEVAQIFYDKDGKVHAVSVTYTGKSDQPTAVAVIGEEVAAGPEGRAYKLVRYPAVGYWIAYSRSAGESPVVSVTMKKMQAVPK